MNKKTAIGIVVSCAKTYSYNLENKNFLFIYELKDHTLSFVETSFLPRNFLHLTGLKIKNDSLSSTAFYDACLSGKLSETDFDFAPNGVTEQKLQVLPNLMNIQKNAKMLGIYDKTRFHLKTNTLVGNTNSCLGFVKDGGYFVPNTALNADIRDISLRPTYKIIAILSKPSDDKRYGCIRYMAKGYIKDRIAECSEMLIKAFPIIELIEIQ